MKNAMWMWTNLPGLGVFAEVAEVDLKPLVDLVEGELMLGRFDDRLSDEGGVRERRPDVLVLVKFTVSFEFLKKNSIEHYLINFGNNESIHYLIEKK